MGEGHGHGHGHGHGEEAAGVDKLAVLALMRQEELYGAVRAEVQKTAHAIREGVSFASALEARGVFPEVAVKMTEVGESTGALQDMLNAVADFYDEEISTNMERFVTLVEPVLLIVMGIVIAGLLLAAGESTRMGSPKPLLDWHGKPLIRYQVDQLRAAGRQLAPAPAAEAQMRERRGGELLGHFGSQRDLSLGGEKQHQFLKPRIVADHEDRGFRVGHLL